MCVEQVVYIVFLQAFCSQHVQGRAVYLTVHSNQHVSRSSFKSSAREVAETEREEFDLHDYSDSQRHYLYIVFH